MKPTLTTRLAVLGLFLPFLVNAVPVEQWHRTTIDTGRARADCAAAVSNPDRVQFQATFTHGGGTKITMPGYYDATNDRFVVDFMPTLTGTWTWSTCSVNDCSAAGVPDLTLDDAMDCAALNGIASTSATEIAAGEGYLADGTTPHPGQLVPDGRKWKFSDSGTYVIPLGVRAMIFWELEADVASVDPVVFSPGHAQFTASVEDLIGAGMNFFQLQLVDGENEYYDFAGNQTNGPGRWDYVFEEDGSSDNGGWRSYDFDEKFWDRFQARLDIMAARGAGVSIIPYDDAQSPDIWCGLSNNDTTNCLADPHAEALLARHLVARTAAYPFMVYNYSIDYNDIRVHQDTVEWVQLIKRLDPYDHPVSSRHKGETSGSTLEPAGQTYDSDGRVISAVFGNMIERYAAEGGGNDCDGGPCAVMFDDSWWESTEDCIVDSRDGTGETARRGAWKNILLGTGTNFRGSDGTCGPGGVCATNRSEWYYWVGSAGAQTCLAADLDLYNASTLPGIARINEIVTEIGPAYGRMEPESSAFNARQVAVGDANEHATFDPDDPDVILVYSIGVDDNPQNSDECPACGGDITIDLGHSVFSGRSYTAEWINPRTGARSPAGTLAGGSRTDLNPPGSEDSLDWVLLLTEGGGGPDSSPPAAISDLGAVGSAGAAMLTWTEVGDDGAGGGRVAGYEARFNTAPIDAGNFDASSPVDTSGWQPQSPGTPRQEIVSGLTDGVQYYFAIRCVDDADNMADVSNSPSAMPSNDLPSVVPNLRRQDKKTDNS